MNSKKTKSKDIFSKNSPLSIAGNSINNNSNFKLEFQKLYSGNQHDKSNQIDRWLAMTQCLSKENNTALELKREMPKSQSAPKIMKTSAKKSPVLNQIPTTKFNRKESQGSKLRDNLKTAPKSISTNSENNTKINLKSNYKSSKRKRDYVSSVTQAIKLQKIFTIGNQNTTNATSFPIIRESLKARGWIEKCCDQTIFEEFVPCKLTDNTMRSLSESEANFIWAVNFLDFRKVKDDTIVSRFPKNTHFTTKVGLCSFLDNFHWFYQPGVSKTITPRTFKIVNTEDIEHFIKEFGLTACVSLLKMVVNEVSTAESDVFFKDGKVPITIIDFANAQCSEYIIFRRHDDIDRKDDVETTAREWTEFLSWFYKIAHENEHFETTSYPMIQALYTMSKITLKNIEPYWPQLEYEGCKNLWVVKPAAQFCGRGIKVFKTVEDIISHVDITADNKITQHIVQKYIEKPLLIFNTKFDIRQWFLVTNIYPLVVWIYKECYLRFSSQLFSLEDLHESIHLTNNAIQKNYTNNLNRDTRLPAENMWHNTTFQEYLNDIGEPGKWTEVILPGIKQGIIGALLASQDEMIDRMNSFELYGADFLLTDDYTPILLEINMGPAMNPSTTITSDLCRRGLQDILKVVLDRKYNDHADVGQFEMLFKQEMGPRHLHVGLDLMVNGTKIIPQKKIKKVNKQF